MIQTDSHDASFNEWQVVDTLSGELVLSKHENASDALNAASRHATPGRDEIRVRGIGSDGEVRIEA